MNTFGFEPLTLDSIGGRIHIAQSRHGYRFNLDSILLAYFVRNAARKNIVEFGTGSGIVSFLLAERFPTYKKILALDCDEQAILQAKNNLTLNSHLNPERIEFRMHDWRKPLKSENFSIVVSNPPWYALQSGRLNPHANRASSRHELHGNLRDWAQGVSRVLQTAGVVFVIYRAERLADLISELRAEKLEPKRMRFVQDREQDAAKSVLVESVKNGKAACKIEAPLILRHDDGEYREETQNMLSGFIHN